jgi:hypothetical protein
MKPHPWGDVFAATMYLLSSTGHSELKAFARGRSTMSERPHPNAILFAIGSPEHPEGGWHMPDDGSPATKAGPLLGEDFYRQFPTEEARRQELVRRYHEEQRRGSRKPRIADGVENWMGYDD